MFKNCAIASEDDEARSAGCAKLAKALREVVQAEQSLQAQNEAHASGVVGKAVVRESKRVTATARPIARDPHSDRDRDRGRGRDTFRRKHSHTAAYATITLTYVVLFYPWYCCGVACAHIALTTGEEDQRGGSKGGAGAC